MLKRKVMHYIKKWVDSKNKKCLVIQGARQTGKTYIVKTFPICRTIEVRQTD